MRFADVKPFQVFRHNNVTAIKISPTVSVNSRTGKDVILSFHDKVTVLERVHPKVCPVDYQCEEVSHG